MALEPDSIGLHGTDELSGELIVVIDNHVSSSCCELSAITRIVTCEQVVIFLFDLVLQLSIACIPMVDIAICVDAQ